MCYDENSIAPAAPGDRVAVTTKDLTLTAGDGTRFAAFEAVPASPENTRAAQVLLLPDVNGLYDFYRELTQRIAETGHRTVAIDYFGRTAGPGPREAGFDRHEHLARLSRDHQAADVAAAVEYLRATADGPVFTMGFCLGGSVSLLAGVQLSELAGVIAFYAWTGGRDALEALPDSFVTEIGCPVLGLFGEEDTAVPVEVARAFDRHLTEAGVAHDIVIYPGQGHGFFEEDEMGEAGHEAAAADAWRRVLAFLGGA